MKCFFIKAVLLNFCSIGSVLAGSYNIPDKDFDEIEIVGEPIVGGSGCKNGSARATFTNDKQAITVLFDEYFSDSAEGRRGRDRKSCSIGVPVSIPDGLSVAVVGLDYRGHVDVQAGATATLTAEYFYAGQGRGPKFTEIWKDSNHDKVEDFYIRHRVTSASYSNCGDDAIFRTNTSLKTKSSKNTGAQAFIQVDSLDAHSKMQYQLQWKKCN